MFWLFRKRDKYPELTVADRLIIAERDAAHDQWAKAIERRDKQRWGHPDLQAYLSAACDDASDRVNLANAEYNAMMKRLTAEAASLIQAAKES